MGKSKNPYAKNTMGVGYLGEGIYKTRENNKKTKYYTSWNRMINRCYNPKFHEKYPTYKDCIVDDEWLCFQNYAKWYEENYYEIEGEVMCLDKDILVKGNKIYSPETCIFVPNRINILFTKSNKSRGDLPIGVDELPSGRFRSHCSILNGNKKELHTIGTYDTIQEAFMHYKKFKENYIKQIADEYKDRIPKKLYDALYNYNVEITD